jgi:hypothetical protein
MIDILDKAGLGKFFRDRGCMVVGVFFGLDYGDLFVS